MAKLPPALQKSQIKAGNVVIKARAPAPDFVKSQSPKTINNKKKTSAFMQDMTKKGD